MLKLIRNFILVLLVVAIFIIIFNFFYNNDNINQDEVIITVFQDKITSTGIEYYLKAKKECYRMSWSEDYKIQQKVFNQWKDVPEVNEKKYVTALGYILNEDNTRHGIINWEWRYGSLKKGIYRVGLYYIGGEQETIFYSEPFKIK